MLHFNLTVNDQVPTVSYSATVLKLTNNTASSDLPHAPNITGSGVITSWEINATYLHFRLTNLRYSNRIGSPTRFGVTTQAEPLHLQ